MVDAFIVSSEVLAEAFGKPFPAGPILVAVPPNTLSFEEYLGLKALCEQILLVPKKKHRSNFFVTKSISPNES